MKTIYCYDEAKKSTVIAGTIINDTFYKKVNPKTHYIKIYKGYGVSASVIDILEKEKVALIVLILPKKSLYTTVEAWRKYSESANLGSGLQHFFPTKYLLYFDKAGLPNGFSR